MIACVWNDSKVNCNHLCNQNIDLMTQNVIRMGVINKYNYGVSDIERPKKNGEKKPRECLIEMWSNG